MRETQIPSVVPSGLRVLLDARWLSRGGAGRATELLLRGLQKLEPAGQWSVWGPAELEDYLWPTAQFFPDETSPRSFFGQRAFRLPPHDTAIFMHQIRPLRAKKAIAVIHDTIPVRWGANSLERRIKRAYLGWSARRAARIITGSRYSADSIATDLDIDRAKIHVITYPTDTPLAVAVREQGSSYASSKTALYVGRFARHKNVELLVRAFPGTSFARSGGQLVAVGGSPRETAALQELVRELELTCVDIRPVCSDEQLVHLFAGSRFLVMPSLEEGFGLPVWEALCAGVPVCASSAGALPEVAGSVPCFPMTDIAGVQRAVDAVADEPARFTRPAQDERGVEEFARDFLELAFGSAP
ncbi:MAG: glycosyltransferase family 4 protein [Actinomycetota bacterium]|nr:glycosyltransferase family 4 protein [Actinomycetota bacterium]